MTITLGRLTRVPLREVWAHEATAFTPWLAEDENLALLGETLNLGELEIQGKEVAVGNFFIDILARDIEGDLVLIENQFGPTDHTHLGQIMTYIGGQEGKVTIVWIAEEFREEHRAAIDWLNASTIDGFDFFAIELEALKIGSSLPAPRFNVVAKPNTWSRKVTRASRGDGEGPLDDRQKAYVAYWSAFATFLEERNAPFKAPVPTPRGYWCGFGFGRSGFRLVALAVFRDSRLSVELYVNHRDAKLAFDLLEGDRAAIEADFGGKLDWQRLNDRKASRIAVHNTDFDPNDEQQWPQQHAWLLDQMERFTRAFRSRIQDLVLEAGEDEPLTMNEPASTSLTR